MVRPCRCAVLLLFLVVLLPAGEGGDGRWYLDDPASGVEGANVRPLAALTWTPPATPVLVAVIDSGLDTDHPELAPLVWTNPAELAGAAGVDDDGNGFVDDLHGWNFIGGPAGERQLLTARLEETRELARLKALAATRKLTAEELAYRDALQAAYDERWRGLAGQGRALFEQVAVLDRLERELTDLGFDPDRFDAEALQAADPFLAQTLAGNERTWKRRQDLRAMHEMLRRRFRTHLNYAWDDRSLIGDDPADLDEAAYGNPAIDVPGRNGHGTMVAGAVARVVAAAVGAEELPRYLRLLAIRTVPDGDEHDKDVANAIRYAADAGARVINLSFGKRFSPGRAAVDAAIAHARERGALLVHGCGNDGLDLAEHPHFPDPVPLDHGPRCPAWLEVGASTPKTKNLAAPFSNYGAEAVDLFAPGVMIRTTADGGGDSAPDGTSLAAPVVSGVAVLALIRHPELDGAALAEALRATARTHPDLAVPRPGRGRKGKVPFASLSRSGGIVDAHRLLQHLDGGAMPPAGPGPTDGDGTDAESPSSP